MAPYAPLDAAAAAAALEALSDAGVRFGRFWALRDAVPVAIVANSKAVAKARTRGDFCINGIT
jgi:hypothetical protein